MPGWNQQLFLLFNGPAQPAAWLLQAAVLMAGSPLVVGPATLVILWIWGLPSRRGGLLAVAAAVLVAQLANQVLGVLYVEPRPFMIGLGHALIPHAADNSFPSDHATFVWALGAGLIATRAAPGVGVAMCVYGLAVAWSRVFLGVHFPLDMLASALVGLVAGGIAAALRGPMSRFVLPPCERIYETVLASLHLPATVFRRRDRPRPR